MKVHGRTGRMGRARSGSLAALWTTLALAAVTGALAACGGGNAAASNGVRNTAAAPPAPGGDTAVSANAPAGPSSLSAKPQGPLATLPPNEMGMIPVLEYHVIQDKVVGQFERPPARFQQDLEELYKRGYRPVTVQDVLDKSIQQLPKGISPVVFTFDDAPPSQFAFVGSPSKIDPRSAIGMWVAFHEKHPDWGYKGVFCMLPAAKAGHAFFGDKGIDGQQSAWRFIKVKWLADHGFQLCDHTLWHARLDKYPDAFVQQQLALGQLAIDSAVSGYKVTTMALPLGMWPKNKPLAWHGSYTDPKTHQTITYDFNSVFEVSGDPDLNPYVPGFDPHHIHRQIMTANALEATLNRLDKPGPHSRYISDGDPKTIAKPTAVAAAPAAQGLSAKK